MLNISVFGLFLLFIVALSSSAYVKIATVLSLLRAGLGASTIPGFLITGVFAVTLSFFVMYPVIYKSLSAVESKLSGESEASDLLKIQALEAGMDVWKEFADKHAHPIEKERFLALSIRGLSSEQGVTADPDVVKHSWQVLAPAFLVSELKEAFATGLSVLLPLLVIDLLVAHILAGIGLMNVNAHVISFPFKVLLFVMVDGWSLITNNLLATYLGRL